MGRARAFVGASSGVAALLAVAAFLTGAREAKAAEISWKGYTWALTDGGMAGVANGSSDNVSVDADGYLHLRIRKNGSTWTAAELFTTTKLGFGTYQWQVDGPIDTFDKNVVLGLFPYGPAAGIGEDGTNEIDIEYSRWGQANGTNGDWTNYPASGTTIGELSYTFSLGGETLSTSRFIWNRTSIEDFLLAGLQPVTSTAQLLKTWKYSPSTPTTNIPQQALPLGMNLWCFDIPSDGMDVEVVVRDFQFVAEGTEPDPSGGAGGEGGSTGAPVAGSGGTASGGAPGGGAPSGGTSAQGGISSSGGRSATGGNASGGGVSAQAGASASSGGRIATGGASAGGATSAGGAPSNGAAGSGTGLTGGAPQAVKPVARETGGCGCSVRERAGALPRSAGLPWLLALVALLVARTRRASCVSGR